MSATGRLRRTKPDEAEGEPWVFLQEGLRIGALGDLVEAKANAGPEDEAAPAVTLRSFIAKLSTLEVATR